MNVSLTPELEKYVRHKVASGLYNNASEVIREALRALLEREVARPKRTDGRSPPRKDVVIAKLAELEKTLRERGVKSVAIFGSLAQGTARPDSDVDLLVDIEPGTRFSLVDLVALKDFLEGSLEQKVDVVTKAGLDPELRDRVLREAASVF